MEMDSRKLWNGGGRNGEMVSLHKTNERKGRE